MKRSSIVGQFALLAAIGCQGQPAPVTDATPTTRQTATIETPETPTTHQEGDTAVTFVSLKVPNMH